MERSWCKFLFSRGFFGARANFFFFQIALLVIAARDDELERVDFYESSGLKKPVKEGTWHGKLKVKKDVDSDEDK